MDERLARAQSIRDQRDAALGLPDDEEIDATLAAPEGQVRVRLGTNTGIATLTRTDARRLRARLGHLLSLDPHPHQPAASAPDRETT